MVVDGIRIRFIVVLGSRFSFRINLFIYLFCLNFLNSYLGIAAIAIAFEPWFDEKLRKYELAGDVCM